MRHADLLPVLALELVLFEGALPLLDVGFLLVLVLVQVQDEEAELALKHVLLPLGQLLLALPQELLVGLLLHGRTLQLLLAASQLLVEERGGGGGLMGEGINAKRTFFGCSTDLCLKVLILKSCTVCMGLLLNLDLATFPCRCKRLILS